MVIANCLYCKKEFKTKPSEIKRGNGKYCTQSCSSFHTARRVPLELMKSRTRKKEKLLQWLTKTKGNKCNVLGCEWNKTLEMHRIEEGGEYSKENTTLLCPNHHSLLTRKICKFEEL